MLKQLKGDYTIKIEKDGDDYSGQVALKGVNQFKMVCTSPKECIEESLELLKEDKIVDCDCKTDCDCHREL